LNKIKQYEVDVIFDGDQELRMKTIYNDDFVVLIEDLEIFIEKHKSSKPEVLCARLFLDNQIIDIKQKIIETIKARRSYG